ncbi:HEAT repeat domain-containing protein [Candidatus Micrarchaeota archaeon]|nr:HEAT repeat domain-containing protein [Candidatus Micrarchaeota archaeon]
MDEEEIKDLIKQLSHAEPYVREYTAKILVGTAEKGTDISSAIPALIKSLGDSEWEVRSLAAGALLYIAKNGTDISSAFPALAKALGDKEGMVGNNAAKALKKGIVVLDCKTKEELLGLVREIKGSPEARKLAKEIYEKWMEKQNKKTGELQKQKMRKPKEELSKEKIKRTI